MLELRRLSKRYGDAVALDQLSFEVAEGRLFGFVGPNGAGKTTAMRIVIGVLEPDSGEVRWRGSPLDHASRARIGYMPEERGLYAKMRVAEQLTYFAQLRGLARARAAARAREWLERLGIGDRAGDRVEELSLGNQQRVQLAAALVHEPELLICDEPFSGLDPVGVDLLSDVLIEETRRRGVPVVFSSHQLELVERLCEGVAIIKDGRLVASGRVEDLRQERGGRRWRAELVDAGDGWAESLVGVRRVAEHVFELADGDDPQRLLAAALETGAVARFGPEQPTLAELFRDVVSEDAERNAAGPAAA
ncbi:MAG: ATP-binding cassette domain-containing protein [Solirubrobacterales bacterium]|nr:ATP-binding cassette domain-containing protein [Solirubrobacterales bacterium]